MTEEPKQIVKYPGSKWKFAPEIISHFPKHKCYVEVFGGSAAVLLRKHPSEIEVYNDINEDIITLFRVVRDDEQRHKLKELLEATPYSRKEQANAANRLREESWSGDLDHAYLTFILYNQSISGMMRDGYNSSWSFASGGKSQSVNTYLSYIDRIEDFAHRFRGVQVECYPWEKILELYDGPKTLFYLDPPYYPDTISQGMYKYDMMPHEHKIFINALQLVKGMSIVSGYDHPLYNHLETLGWSRVEAEFKTTMAVDKDKERDSRTEVLWISPSAAGKRGPIIKSRKVVNQQTEMFT